MSNRLISKFSEELNGHDIAIFEGPYTPLFFLIPWSKDKNRPLSPLIINKGKKTVVALDEFNYRLASEVKFREYFNKQISILDLENEYQSLARECNYLYEKVSDANLSLMKEEDIMALLHDATTVWKRIESTVYIETFDYDIALNVIGQDNKKLLDAVWETATHPSFVSFEGRRLSRVIDLLEELEDVKLIIPKVRYIYTDYHWSKSDIDIQGLLQDFKNEFSSKKNELSTILEETKKREVAHMHWFDGLAYNEKHLVEFIQLIMRLRDVRKDPIAQIQVVFVMIVTELLRRAGVDSRCAFVLNAYECAGGIKYLQEHEKDLIKRLEGFVSLVNFDGSEIETEYCDFDEAIAELHARTQRENQETLKGQTACRGNVVGTARVVLDANHPGEFSDGDILVTGMTRPEFVPLMKRAGAVVTNEGGITCHAAIVSRELKKPCIIGTKIATQVLKDGDLVEVDAERGIVTILKHASDTNEPHGSKNHSGGAKSCAELGSDTVADSGVVKVMGRNLINKSREHGQLQG